MTLSNRQRFYRHLGLFGTLYWTVSCPFPLTLLITLCDKTLVGNLQTLVQLLDHCQR